MADLNLEHLEETRTSTILFRLTQRLIETRFRDEDDVPQLHLFGQLKRITREWMTNHLECKGGTYPAQLLYQTLADMSCERITAGITRALAEENPIVAILDPYNPIGSTEYVHFMTSKRTRYQTDPRKSHINWVITDSDWEAEFCRVVEAHPRVVSYVKNHSLGFEVPYRYGSEPRIYRPDFIVQVDDGNGPENRLNLVVEIKGYRGEDAKEKKATMETRWIPGVNNLGTFGRWAFAEFTDVYEMEQDFADTPGGRVRTR